MNLDSQQQLLQQVGGLLKTDASGLVERVSNLQSQAKAARHNIEKFNKTDDYCQPMANQSEVNQSTLPELLQAADLAIETQTLHLPRRAAQLINN